MKLRTKFQDEDFDYGEVVDAEFINSKDRITVRMKAKKGGIHTFYYQTLKEFYEDFEDGEETKLGYVVDLDGEILPSDLEYITIEKSKEIGNYFEAEEKAEKAVEKLKAITRLSKCGFKFEGYADRDRANGGDIVIYAHIDIPNNNLLEEAQPAMLKDLDLLFSRGEE